MPYKYSNLDRNNLAWFKKDTSKGTLINLELSIGHLRGLYPFSMEFNYPISVISGRNGSGKSTILSMAACAFHNKRKGFKLPKRKKTYYTFSDFFIQSSDEIAPDGIIIAYKILYDKWQPSKNMPKGVGLGRQFRKKNTGGKWNNYATRADRNVVFFGIERVVPHSEKSVSKSYRRNFIEEEGLGFEAEVRDVVGRILRKRYDRFWYAKHSKYRLPHVTHHGITYSGFNMGAGENALFDIFSTIHACPEGLLMVVDEIELGLHEDAQKRLINELKKVCKYRHVQIIATTHSPSILRSIPPEARFHIEVHKKETRILNGISPLYAAGLLASENSNELDIFVEDNIAEYLIKSLLDNEIRKRVNIISIGSSNAIVRQLSAAYKNPRNGDRIAIFDGDQSNKVNQFKTNFIKSFENDIDEKIALEWFEKRIAFLPGDKWPERWLIEKMIISNTETLSEGFRVDDTSFKEYVEEALSEGKHQEIHCLSESLCIKEESLCCFLSRWATEQFHDDFLSILTIIKNILT